MPIIGVNESGKTTILQAIFAFDYMNDRDNEDGRHLKDVSNLFRTTPELAFVSAEIEITPSEFRRIGTAAEKLGGVNQEFFGSLSRKKRFPDTVIIHRNIAERKYHILPAEFGSDQEQDALAHKIISNLPYILYFDDFRDKIPGRIEIARNEEGFSTWASILQQLFTQTDPAFSISKLVTLEDRHRRTTIAKIERHLNETLTKAWKNFRLDNREALQIQISYEPDTSRQTNGFIRMDVVEKDGAGDEHYFYISDRSKGFYWFFNFVMKLEFNPKIVGNQAHSIFLLDEPGSYLHAFAQRKLCQKLRKRRLKAV